MAPLHAGHWPGRAVFLTAQPRCPAAVMDAAWTRVEADVARRGDLDLTAAAEDAVAHVIRCFTESLQWQERIGYRDSILNTVSHLPDGTPGAVYVSLFRAIAVECPDHGTPASWYKRGESVASVLSDSSFAFRAGAEVFVRGYWPCETDESLEEETECALCTLVATGPRGAARVLDVLKIMILTGFFDLRDRDTRWQVFVVSRVAELFLEVLDVEGSDHDAPSGECAVSELVEYLGQLLQCSELQFGIDQIISAGQSTEASEVVVDLLSDMQIDNNNDNNDD